MPRERHLSSLVVHARPEALPEVARKLAAMGCELHLTSATGKLVVTLETDDARRLSDAINEMQSLRGVVAATLVFHHHEPDEEPPAASAKLETHP